MKPESVFALVELKSEIQLAESIRQSAQSVLDMLLQDEPPLVNEAQTRSLQERYTSLWDQIQQIADIRRDELQDFSAVTPSRLIILKRDDKILAYSVTFMLDRNSDDSRVVANWEYEGKDLDSSIANFSETVIAERLILGAEGQQQKALASLGHLEWTLKSYLDSGV